MLILSIIGRKKSFKEPHLYTLPPTWLVLLLTENGDYTLPCKFIACSSTRDMNVLPSIFDIHLNDILYFIFVKSPRFTIFGFPISPEERDRKASMRNCLNNF